MTIDPHGLYQQVYIIRGIITSYGLRRNISAIVLDGFAYEIKYLYIRVTKECFQTRRTVLLIKNT